MAPGYRIREVPAREHVDAIERLDTACFPQDDRLKAERHRWWFAYHEGKPVAYAAMRPLTTWHGCLFFSRAGVLPTHRRHGLQKRLIRHRLLVARREGFKVAITYTSPDNVHSAHALLACGFRLYVPQQKWGCDGALYFQRAV